jgi:ankyrin repeat protein
MSMREAVDDFVRAAIDDPGSARALRNALPELADEGLFPALVLCDAPRVEAIVSVEPRLAVEKGGVEVVEPLVYVCFSRLGIGDAAATARVLLAHGADPNTTCIADGHPDSPLSCLYAATGRSNNPALARVLLEAGANPNDGESVYHSVEHADLECLRLLLEFGGQVPGSNAVKHALDSEHPETLRLLIGAGIDPVERDERGQTALHWAVFRGRSAETVGMLVDAGVPLDLPRKDGRTAYAMARVKRDSEVATALAARGASTALSALDRAAAGEPFDPAEISWTAEDARMLPDLVAARATDSVRALLDLGLPCDGRGEAGGTALHWACWKGYPDIAKLLLERGASLEVRDTEFDGTPLDWLEHGRQFCPERELGDYAGVAALLGSTARYV